MNQDTKERRRSADLELASLRKTVEEMKDLDDELHEDEFCNQCLSKKRLRLCE
jgi:hypothetical protein